MGLSDTLSNMVIEINEDLERIDYDSDIAAEARYIRDCADSLRQTLDNSGFAPADLPINMHTRLLAEYEQTLIEFSWCEVEHDGGRKTLFSASVKPEVIGACWLAVCEAASNQGLCVPTEFQVEHMIYDSETKVHVSWSQDLLRPRK
jgi:hypothetical protein